PVDGPVTLTAQGIGHERAHAGERPAPLERHGAIPASALAVTHEAVRLVDPLPAVQRLGGARARVYQAVGGFARDRQLASRHGHRAVVLASGARVALGAPLVR